MDKHIAMGVFVGAYASCHHRFDSGQTASPPVVLYYWRPVWLPACVSAA